MRLFTLPGRAVEQWGVFEITLTGASPIASPMDVGFSGTFTQGRKSITVPGFWDGGESFRLRFSPPTSGEWKYHTASEMTSLDGKRGTFTVLEPSGGNHGLIEVFDTFYLRHIDGAADHQFGTTCYAWVHQTPALQEETLKSLAASPFNKIRFCVFSKSYT